MSSLRWEVSGDLALCLRTGPTMCSEWMRWTELGWVGGGRETAVPLLRAPGGTARSASRAGVWGPRQSETMGQMSCSGQSRPRAAHVG